jgi:tRNA 5-methylaminomethyl-2-thiouridine biosynthesis bifunctional protein
LTTDVLVFCTGAGTLTLPGLHMLPLRVVRGQVSEVAATDESEQWRQVQCHAGYLTPAIDGVHSLGASYQPMADGDEIAALAAAGTLSSADSDDQYNLETLRQHLPQHWQALGGDNIRLLGSRSGLRCRTADYLPVLGALDGHADIWINTAHGSRGISSTTLCADILADRISGLMPAADHSLLQALAVQRLQ